MLNSFYNSVYSRTNNFGFPQRFNLTFAVILIFVFGGAYLFRGKLRNLFSSIVKKKNKSKLAKSASKIIKKISPWGSRFQVMATNIFFLYMPENINYLVVFLKNAYQIKNVPFMIYNLIILFLFVKIFADFLIFYINTLVNILIRKTHTKEGVKRKDKNTEVKEAKKKKSVKGAKGQLLKEQHSVSLWKKENDSDIKQGALGKEENNKPIDEVQMIAVKGTPFPLNKRMSINNTPIKILSHKIINNFQNLILIFDYSKKNSEV